MSNFSIKRLDASEAGFLPALDQLIAWDMVSDSAVESTVTEILQQVRSRGDAALVEYSNRFDRRDCSSIDDFCLRKIFINNYTKKYCRDVTAVFYNVNHMVKLF